MESAPLLAVMDATRGCNGLEPVLQWFDAQPAAFGLLLHPPEFPAANALPGHLAANSLAFPLAPEGSVAQALAATPARAWTHAAYLPCDLWAGPPSGNAAVLAGKPDVITPLLPSSAVPAAPNPAVPAGGCGWIAPWSLAGPLFSSGCATTELGLVKLIAEADRSGRLWRWNSCRVSTGDPLDSGLEPQPLMSSSSRILAVVPHFACEPWLAQCLHSLTTQTHPPANIAVIDDASPEPPRDIVRRFPGVTLLATSQNVGPENILRSVMRTAAYDAFLLQDADDWSSANRLELMLQAAGETGAAVVSTQELRLFENLCDAAIRLYPADVNAALARQIAHYVCHGASLVSRAGAKRVGGLDPSLRVTADTDFILRLFRVASIVNVPDIHYYRRIRPDSRTTALSTGQGSALRDFERELIYRRARGETHTVIRDAKPVSFQHLLGPKLAMGPW